MYIQSDVVVAKIILVLKIIVLLWIIIAFIYNPEINYNILLNMHNELMINEAIIKN